MEIFFGKIWHLVFFHLIIFELAKDGVELDPGFVELVLEHIGPLEAGRSHCHNTSCPPLLVQRLLSSSSPLPIHNCHVLEAIIGLLPPGISDLANRAELFGRVQLESADVSALSSRTAEQLYRRRLPTGSRRRRPPLRMSSPCNGSVKANSLQPTFATDQSLQPSAIKASKKSGCFVRYPAPCNQSSQQFSALSQVSFST